MQGPPVLPIDVTAVVSVFMGTLIVLIPVAGVTIRFALKPIAEAIARIRESQGANQEMSIMAQRLDLLERQLSGVESELHRLHEVQEFQAQLKAPEH